MASRRDGKSASLVVASFPIDGLYEAVTTLEETERIARRVLGGAHPVAMGIGTSLRAARTLLLRVGASHLGLSTAR